MSHGIYTGPIDCMSGHGALLREPTAEERDGDHFKSDLIMAQFDDMERWGRELPSLALGWHAFERAHFKFDRVDEKPKMLIMDDVPKLDKDEADAIAKKWFTMQPQWTRLYSQSMPRIIKKDPTP